LFHLHHRVHNPGEVISEQELQFAEELDQPLQRFTAKLAITQANHITKIQTIT